MKKAWFDAANTLVVQIEPCEYPGDDTVAVSS
jgi:hypothetical protein